MGKINDHRIDNKGQVIKQFSLGVFPNTLTLKFFMFEHTKQLRALAKLKRALRQKRKEIKIIMQTTKEAREQEDHMRREFTNMKTKIAGDLVESNENIEKLKSDIVETKEQAQKTTNDIADALTASLAKSSGHARMVGIIKIFVPWIII